MSMHPTSTRGHIPQFHRGDRLAKARTDAGLTQQQMATEIGVARRSIVRWEQGHDVRKSALLLYSMRTGVPVEWLEAGVAPDDPKLPGLDSNQEPIGSRLRLVLVDAA